MFDYLPSFSWSNFHHAALTLDILGCCLVTTLKSIDQLFLSLKGNYFLPPKFVTWQHDDSQLREPSTDVYRKSNPHSDQLLLDVTTHFPYVTNFLRIRKLPLPYQVNFFLRGLLVLVPFLYDWKLNAEYSSWLENPIFQEISTPGGCPKICCQWVVSITKTRGFWDPVRGMANGGSWVVIHMM